jgi:hypothetical protein
MYAPSSTRGMTFAASLVTLTAFFQSEKTAGYSTGSVSVSDVRSNVSFETSLDWVLRLGAFMCFVGHGAFGIITKEAWLPFFAVAGIGPELAYKLMPVIGTIDILLGTLALIRPRAALVVYMTLWAIWTAALRPLSGQSVWEMLERGGNYGVPFALLLASEMSRAPREWFRRLKPSTMTPELAWRLRIVLSLATALLLVGHGALSVEGKKEIVAHYALILPGAVSAAVALGWAEIAIAALVLIRPTIGLCVFIAVWKLATESLFIAAGAPVWEWIERGGSYTAPLALALVLLYMKNTNRLAVSREMPA